LKLLIFSLNYFKFLAQILFNGLRLHHVNFKLADFFFKLFDTFSLNWIISNILLSLILQLLLQSLLNFEFCIFDFFVVSLSFKLSFVLNNRDFFLILFWFLVFRPLQIFNLFKQIRPLLWHRLNLVFNSLKFRLPVLNVCVKSCDFCFMLHFLVLNCCFNQRDLFFKVLITSTFLLDLIYLFRNLLHLSLYYHVLLLQCLIFLNEQILELPKFLACKLF
jgi:hypothetical protein